MPELLKNEIAFYREISELLNQANLNWSTIIHNPAAI